MNELTGLVEDVGAEIGQPVHLGSAVGKVVKKHRHVVIRVFVRIAARANRTARHAPAVRRKFRRAPRGIVSG
jgi:hypothetical protein